MPPLMIAVLHRHRGNVQSLLNARADPWQAVPVVSLCNHLGIGSDSCHDAESVNVLQVSVARAQWIRWRIYFPQAEMLRVIEQQKGLCTYSHDLTAMTEHATLLLDNIIQKYQTQYRASAHARLLYFASLATNIGTCCRTTEQSLHSSRLADIGFKLLVWLGYLNETSNLGTQKRIPLKDVLSLGKQMQSKEVSSHLYMLGSLDALSSLPTWLKPLHKAVPRP